MVIQTTKEIIIDAQYSQKPITQSLDKNINFQPSYFNLLKCCSLPSSSSTAEATAGGANPYKD